ncbi:NAD(P)/FAD-dependent oxidoreductase [Streptomyces sp. NBC_00439]|uniref:NAD(P)/FAD-dependent oxidoreductase n=1 Tax=Streptomyces sp. NBC_00439 TaxID=2903650 RepID=UPI00224F3460|nr:tryptophan 7-halogenase [Streptomyces sp. NBC_00439]MCX5103465.1 tryptophan 7-halogenase [Streptomyces sp. NBC_00439]
MQKAVVLGGSYAGLFAARVLSDHADEVVVIEADGQVDGSAGHGAPQRQQLHALLGMGHTQLEVQFPGITRELVDAGALLGSGSAVRFYVDGEQKADVPGDQNQMIGATRPFIERHVRRRVLEIPNVRIQAGRAQDLIIRGSRVVGVHYSAGKATDGTSGPGSELEADLVVDAMGRSSRLGAWLQNHGWDAAPTERMRIDLGYATATFTRGRELPDTVIAHATPGPASGYQPTLCEPGAIAAVEGNRWAVVVSGYAGHRPGRDPDQFRDRMLRCVAPLQEIAQSCEMEGEVLPYSFRESQRREFSRLTRFPGGLVAVGDSVSSVNPIYGQGLTLAALQAASLSAHLRSGVSVHTPAWDYFRRIAGIVDAAWSLSTSADLAQPHVSGPYPRGYRFTRWAADKITQASVVDPIVNTVFMNVLHMRAHPKSLTRPRVLLRTARVLATR